MFSFGPERWESRAKSAWRGYAISLALVGVVTAVGFRIEPRMAHTNLAMLYLLTVVISALRLGRGPAMVAAVTSSFIFDFCFIPPAWSLAITDIWYLITLVTLLAVGLVISTLAGHVREQAWAARDRESYTAALYALSRSLAEAAQLDEILEAIARQIVGVFSQPLVIFLPGPEGLRVQFCSPGFTVDEEEKRAARQAFGQGRNAGRWTAVEAGARACYLPLKTWRGVIGVLGIKAGDSADWLSAGREELLEGFVSQAASSLERALLAEEAGRVQLLQEANRMQKALLSSISHNLRTPLASITGALTSLLEDAELLDTRTRRELLENAQEESERLNRVVGNLLDMTRLEAGVLGVKKQPSDVQDVIGTALEQLGGMARGRRITCEIAPGLPLVPMDPVLVAQTVANLLDNALKYSPAAQPVEVRAALGEGRLEIGVADRGPGIPESELERVFEKFYRSPQAGRVNGMGLGLSISKRFVEAQGGSIRARNRDGGGALVMFTLPMEAAGEVCDERGRTASTRS